MNAAMICQAIGMEPQVICRLEQEQPAVEAYRDLIEKITYPETAESAATALAEKLEGNDMAILACQLESSAIYYDRHLNMGICPEILVETLKCFSRFL